MVKNKLKCNHAYYLCNKIVLEDYSIKSNTLKQKFVSLLMQQMMYIVMPERMNGKEF